MKKNSKFPEKKRQKLIDLVLNKKVSITTAAKVCGVPYANAYMWIRYRIDKNTPHRAKAAFIEQLKDEKHSLKNTFELGLLVNEFEKMLSMLKEMIAKR